MFNASYSKFSEDDYILVAVHSSGQIVNDVEVFREFVEYVFSGVECVLVPVREEAAHAVRDDELEAVSLYFCGGFGGEDAPCVFSMYGQE